MGKHGNQLNEESLKSLAEFAAEFLRWEKGDDSWWSPPLDEPNWLQERDYHDRKLCNIFFEPNYINNEAPILAHLALKEMEKRGYCFAYHGPDYYRNSHTYTICKSQDITEKCLALSCNENQFVALWSSIEQTGEK